MVKRASSRVLVVCLGAGCVEPPDPPNDADELGSEASESSASTTDTDESESSAGESSSIETGPQCEASEACPSEAPICEAGACLPCDEAQALDCAGERPATPVCVAETGQCVQCSNEDASACGGELPICVEQVCAPCRLHADCPASGCNMETGACMPEDRVWYVDYDVVESGDGSEGAPFKTITEAIGMIGIGEQGTIVIQTLLEHPDQIDITDFREVALVDDTVASTIVSSDAWAQIEMNFNAKLFIDSFLLRSPSGKVVDCNTSKIWMRNMRMRAGTDAFAGHDCEYYVETSAIETGRWAFLLDGDDRLELTNSFVEGANDHDAIVLSSSGARVKILDSTIGAGYFDVSAVQCTQSTGFGSSIRNSLIVSLSNTLEIVDCPDLEITDSTLETPLADNLSLGGVQLNWFEDYFEADFHLTDAAPPTLAGAGVWRDGDPRFDIDGDARPSIDGAPDYAGADRPSG